MSTKKDSPTSTRWNADDLAEADCIAEAMRRATGKNVSRSDVLRLAARRGFPTLRAECSQPQESESAS